MAFTLGVTIRVSFTFTDTDGTYADPTTVTVYVTPPGQGRIKYVYLTDAALVKSATGRYYIDITCDRLGKWHYQAIGTGTVTVISPTNWSFDVTREPS